MTDIEKEIIKDERILKLVIKHFQSIDKIKKETIDEFILKYNQELTNISDKRNWKVWLLAIKKKNEYKDKRKQKKRKKR